MANGGINFFDCYPSFFTMLRAFVNCAKTVLLNLGVIKTHNFLRFPIAKGGTKAIAHLPVADWSSF
jgi:hypothetical protein